MRCIDTEMGLQEGTAVETGRWRHESRLSHQFLKPMKAESLLYNLLRMQAVVIAHLAEPSFRLRRPPAPRFWSTWRGQGDLVSR